MLYGNECVRRDLLKMAKGERLAQCILFYGDKGTGKKALSKWFAQLLLCETESAPCGECKNCKTIQNNVHPDVVWVPHSGKLGGFSVETVRNICTDAVVAPNSGKRKVYIFDDCDKMDVRSQNILLKIIEEPPAFAYFIFTAAARQSLLSTVLSRLMPFGIAACTEDEAAAALEGRGYSHDDVLEAVSCFHGNIGQCIDYIEDDKVKEFVSLTKEAVRCIIEKCEYDLLKVFCNVSTDRNAVLSLLRMLENVFRDASVLRLDMSLPCVSCDLEGAKILAGRLSAARGQYFHKCILNAYSAINANVNLQLTLSALCAEIITGR